ncbi:MAG: hypothetical protein ACR2H1_06970 [Limisphaerales bacterium]
MKKQIIITTMVAWGFLTAPLTHAKRMNMNHTPEAVQKTITAQAPAENDLKGIYIDQKQKRGTNFYEVKFQEKGRDKKIWIAEDGSLLQDNGKGETNERVARVVRRDAKMEVKYAELPPAVQTVLNAKGGAGQVALIHKKAIKGQTVYEVEFKEPGKNPKIWVAEDGSLVKMNEKMLKEGGEAIMFNSLPPAVRKTINTERGTEADVEKIKVKKETENSRTVYKVDWEEKGKNTRLSIAEDGSVLKDSRK